VLRQMWGLTIEQIRFSAAPVGSPAFILAVIRMAPIDQATLVQMVDPTMFRSRVGDDYGPLQYVRAKELLAGVLEAAPDVVWDNWGYWAPLYDEVGLRDVATAFANRHDRRDTGKSARNVERRITAAVKEVGCK
jgi:hypothetical protein